jgi:hypothetical protein
MTPYEKLALQVAEIKHPVYGIIDLPEGLTYHGRLINTCGLESSVTLSYRSTHYPPSQFDGRISNIQIETGRYNTRRYLNLDRMLQDQGQPIRTPLVWEGTIALDGNSFRGTILYHTSPVICTGFHFESKSERLFLGGHSHGPSCDEMIRILKGLQVVSANPYSD